MATQEQVLRMIQDKISLQQAREIIQKEVKEKNKVMETEKEYYKIMNKLRIRSL